MLSHVSRLLSVVLLLSFTSASLANDLGTWGHVYPIIETDFLTFIHDRLLQLKKNGAFDQMKTHFIARVKAHVLRPTPVMGLTTTSHPKTFYVNPTFVLQRDILDANGHVLFQKGLKINPLDTVQLHSVLCFLNADDPKQIAFANRERAHFDFVKTILVQGNIKQATQELRTRVYFDQEGRLSKKLELKHIPCLVKQVGKKLKVQEFSVDA